MRSQSKAVPMLALVRSKTYVDLRLCYAFDAVQGRSSVLEPKDNLTQTPQLLLIWKAIPFNKEKI